MRISTPLMYQQAVSAMGTQQSELLHTQQQISTGRRMLTGADDPVAAAQALVVRQSKADNDRFSANMGSARDLLNLNDSVLGNVTDLLQNVRTSAINAGTATLNASDRAALANEISSQLDQLVGLANSRDGNGNFLYGGYQNGSAPFTGGSTAPVVYGGDQGVQTLQVGPTRYMNVTQNGAALFDAIRNGNGTFAVSAGPTNTGTGLIGATSVANAAAITGDTYQLQFNVTGSTTTYDVVDVTTSTTVSTGNAFAPAAPITVAGMTMSISGAPAAGDRFTIAPSTSQSIFTTLQNLVAALNAPTGSDAQRTSLANGINDAVQNIDHALENVLTARSDVGANLRELDALSAAADDRGVQYQQTLSRVEDLDYNQALSMFSQQQLALDAAQKSFLKTSGLSLFALL